MVLQIIRISIMVSGAGLRNLPLRTILFKWSAIALNSEGRKYICDCSCFDSKFECGTAEQSWEVTNNKEWLMQGWKNDVISFRLSLKLLNSCRDSCGS